jgi:uncharacterized protein YfaP (DUF2135 family)
MLNTGILGAKVQSWKSANPRDILKRLMEENPRMEKPALLAALRHELLSEDRIEYLDAVIEYWFSNNYHSLVAPRVSATRPSPAVAKAAKQEKIAAIRQKVERHIEEKVEARLLDFIMPSGKTLRDSTGADCAKAGGWLTKIAGKVNARQRVGNVLSEEQVRKLFKAR